MDDASLGLGKIIIQFNIIFENNGNFNKMHRTDPDAFF